MTKIDIKELIPFLNPGWVACDKDGTWIWSNKEMVIENNVGWSNDDVKIVISDSYTSAFNIEPAKDWTKSLIKVGGK